MFTQRTGRRGRAVQGGLATVALPSAGRNELITHISQDAQGNDVVVSGTVAVPKGPTPDGGWPVISWAHGTTGVADACAPSADAPDGPAHDYLGGVEAALDRYVADRYAVVATDYVGLGTPGGHPYMNGVSEANAVTDIVRASRQLDDSLGSDWYAIGHSQGGHAALWTAATGAKRSPDLKLRGAIAIARGGDLSSTAQYFSTGQPGVRAALAFLPIILLGAQAGDPSISAASFVTPATAPLLAEGRIGCIGQIRDMVGEVPLDQVFPKGVDTGKLVKYLAAQSPNSLRPTVPVLVTQGTADTVVVKPSTDGIVKSLCRNGASITYRSYAGADHRGAVPKSFDDATTFIKAVNSGKPEPSSC